METRRHKNSEFAKTETWLSYVLLLCQKEEVALAVNQLSAKGIPPQIIKEEVTRALSTHGQKMVIYDPDTLELLAQFKK